MRVVFIDSICNPANPGVGGVSDIQWRLARELVDAGGSATVVGAYEAGVRGPDERVDLVTVTRAVVKRNNILKHMARAMLLARAAAAVAGADVFVVPDSVTAAALVLVGRGRRVVWHGHSNVYHHSRNGVPWDASMYRLMLAATRLAAGRIGVVIALGESLITWWQRSGFSREHIAVIPLGVDAPAELAANWVEPTAWQGARYRLLYVGRLSTEKGGYSELLAALAPLADELDAHLLIVGDGPQRGGIERQIAARGLEKSVVCVGQQSSEFVALAYSHADLVLLPSRSEMLPRVMLESWAAGTAFMATAVGAIPDYLRDSENGFLLASTEPVYMRERIRAALTDPALRASVAAGGRATAATLAWPRVAAEFDAVYRKVWCAAAEQNNMQARRKTHSPTVKR